MATAPEGFVTWLCDAPARTEVFGACSGDWLATFTQQARTVLLSGPAREFCEGPHRVQTRHWVRLHPAPFEGEPDAAWLALALEANRCGVPDVLALLFQYVKGSPPLFEGDLQVAGDARYGPGPRGAQEEGADFNDYLGLTWHYDGEPDDRPEARQKGCLDCSGFVRMVYGYRQSLPAAAKSSVPLCRAPRADRSALPRRAHEMFHHGPGVVLIGDTGTRPEALDLLTPGDLLFFNADPDDGPRLDHVGVYLGPDTEGHPRFISSRKQADGPTMGDVGGPSTLDGNRRYARRLRCARRV